MLGLEYQEWWIKEFFVTRGTLDFPTYPAFSKKCMDMYDMRGLLNKA